MSLSLLLIPSARSMEGIYNQDKELQEKLFNKMQNNFHFSFLFYLNPLDSLLGILVIRIILPEDLLSSLKQIQLTLP